MSTASPPSSSVETEETAALVSALCWILRSAAANSLDHSRLHSELLQLGTPKEHAGAVSRVFRDQSSGLLALAIQSSLRLSTLQALDRRVILLARSVQDIMWDVENKIVLHFIILSGRKDDEKYVWEKHGQLSFKINCKNTTVNRFF